MNKKSLLKVVTIALLSSNTFAQTIIYVDVDATGNNDGSSWTDAYTDPYTALWSNTATDAELWIADGFYSTTSSTESFTIDHDEHIYGGFNGTETARDQRDFRNNISILSGDAGWNDAGTFPNSTSNWSDNSEHVIEITSSNAVIIDGITIEGGNANGIVSAGGAVYVSSIDLNSLTIQNCNIRNNAADNRAAIMYYTASPNSSFNFYNNIVEGNYNTGNFAYTVEYRLNGLAGISGEAHIVNNLFKSNSCNSSTAGAICGRFTNLPPGYMDVYLVNNTIIDNPNGDDLQAPFACEFGSGNATTYLNIQNNILYNNGNATKIMGLSAGSTSQINYDSSDQNIQDSPDIEGLTNTHVVSSSPFIDYANEDYAPISQYQTTGQSQAYSIDYPTYDLYGNDRLTGAGEIGIGAIQASLGVSSVSELNEEMITVYPNPAKDFLTVEWDEYASAQLTLINLVGQTVLDQKIEGTSLTSDVSNLEAGIYIAVVKLNDQIHKFNITLH